MASKDFDRRLEALESKMKAQSTAAIWVDMNDNNVRVDVNHKRGEELTFESVYACAQWAEKKMHDSDKVTGVAFVSNVMDLFIEEPFSFTPDDLVNETGVIMNLAGRGQDSLAGMAYATWQKMRNAARVSAGSC